MTGRKRRFIVSLFRRLGAAATGRQRLSANYLGRLAIFTFAFLTLSGLVFSPRGSSAKPQYPPAYEEQAPVYQPGYHKAQYRDRDWGRYPDPYDDLWPSFAVILLVAILILLVIALFLPDIRESRRVALRDVLDANLDPIIRGSIPATPVSVAAAKTAILAEINR
jgi:hypothetical protein